MLSAIRHRREAAPSWGQASISRALGPLLDAVGHGVALLDKRKEPDERCILDVRPACQNGDFDCEAPTEAQHRVAPKMPHSKTGCWGTTPVPPIPDMPNDADRSFRRACLNVRFIV